MRSVFRGPAHQLAVRMCINWGERERVPPWEFNAPPVCLSVCLSVYIYISYVRHFWSRGPRATRKRKPVHLKFKGHMHACCIYVANASRAITTLIERLHMYSSSLITSNARPLSVCQSVCLSIYMLGTDVKSGPFYSRPTVSKPARRLRRGPDGCDTGQTALQLFISTTDGFKAVQTDEQLSWTVPKLCIKCTAARFSYIFVKIHVVQCSTPPVLVIFL